MQIQFLRYLFVGLIVLAIGCSKDGDPAPSNEKELLKDLIEGAWKLDKILDEDEDEVGFSDHSSGLSSLYVMLDSKGDVIRHTESHATKQEEGEWELKDDELTLEFDREETEWKVLSVSKKTLTIEDEDDFILIFKRIDEEDFPQAPEDGDNGAGGSTIFTFDLNGVAFGTKKIYTSVIFGSEVNITAHDGSPSGGTSLRIRVNVDNVGVGTYNLTDVSSANLDIFYSQGNKIYKPTEGKITFTTLTTDKVVATFECIVAETGNPANVVEITNGKVNVLVTENEDGVPVGDEDEDDEGDGNGDGSGDPPNVFSFKISGEDFDVLQIQMIPFTDGQGDVHLSIRAYGTDGDSYLQLQVNTGTIGVGTYPLDATTGDLMIWYVEKNGTYYSSKGEITFTTLTKQRVVATFKSMFADLNDVDSFEITDGIVDVAEN